jgi:ferredoxin
MWRDLQELAGIQNSHALALLEREKQAWEEEKQREIEELRAELGQQTEQIAAAEAPALEEGAAAEEVVEVKGPIEEAYIETPRCNTCDECTKKNPKMFAYNENKQAYIADIDAGTFRDLVESAEVCKVAILHPGKPRNPDEANLEELIKRAEPFNVAP